MKPVDPDYRPSGRWGENDTMHITSTDADGPPTRVHGVRLRDYRTDTAPITREEYRARHGV